MCQTRQAGGWYGTRRASPSASTGLARLADLRLDRVRRTIRRHDLARRRHARGRRRCRAAPTRWRSPICCASSRAPASFGSPGSPTSTTSFAPAAADDEAFCARAGRSARPAVRRRSRGCRGARAGASGGRSKTRRARRATRFFERARVAVRRRRRGPRPHARRSGRDVLLRLIRGAGARGLAAMHPRRGARDPPAARLPARRARALSRRRAACRSSTTSRTTMSSIPRNRVRAELLPLLEGALQSVDRRRAGRRGRAGPRRVALDGRRRRRCAPELAAGEPACWLDAERLDRARGARSAAPGPARHDRGLAGGQSSFAHVERGAASSAVEGGPASWMPRDSAWNVGPELVLTEAAAGATGDAARPFPYPLSIPGEVLCRGGLRRVGRGAGSASAARVPSERGAVAVVQLDRCGTAGRPEPPPGRPVPAAGLGGRKKLQDFFVDRKVARRERDRCRSSSTNDRIVWVAGHAIDEEFRVTDPAQAVLILRLKGLGGSRELDR